MPADRGPGPRRGAGPGRAAHLHRDPVVHERGARNRTDPRGRRRRRGAERRPVRRRDRRIARRARKSGRSSAARSAAMSAASSTAATTRPLTARRCARCCRRIRPSPATSSRRGRARTGQYQTCAAGAGLRDRQGRNGPRSRSPSTGEHSKTVCGVFANWAHKTPRMARLSVYFTPPDDWVPQRRQRPASPPPRLGRGPAQLVEGSKR